MKFSYFPNDITKENIDWYYLGVRQGIWTFSWMKDGVSYVGSGIKTMKQAYEELHQEYCEKCDVLGHKPLTL